MPCFSMHIQAENLGKRIADRWIFQNVQLSLTGGQRYALTGASGSGKSLLMRALVLLDQPSAGRILVQGKPLRGNEVPRFRARAIYLPQFPAFGGGSVADVLDQPIAFGTQRRRLSERQTKVLEEREFWADRLGITANVFSTPTAKISGGERQRISLLRALQLQPEFLLLDEPTASLDRTATRQVEQALMAWQQQEPESRMLFWVSHDIEQVHRIDATHWELHDGSLKEME